MKEITLKISIDERHHTAEFRRVGCRVPETKVYDDSPEALAGIWRDLADYAMREAFNLEHSRDFCAPDYTNAEREKMALKVSEEHKNIFERMDCE